MVRRKGIGYIIEAFVSTLVVMVFVFSSFGTISSPEKDWGDFRTRVTAEDATYALQNSDNLNNFVNDGDMATLSALGSSITSSRLSMSGSISGPPTGEFSIGIFTEKNEMHDVPLTTVSGSDRCSGDLEEIDSNFAILRTTSSSMFETRHNTRLYFADADPENFGGTNSVQDYDTYYVDTGTNCQFSEEEGPHRFDNYVTFEDSPTRTYQIKNVSAGSSSTALIYDSDIVREINQKFSEYPGAQFEINRFNFSDNYETNDMLVFLGNSTLDNIESKKPQFYDYADSNPILFSMNLNETLIDSSFISETGLSIVNLSMTSSGTREPGFSDTRDSKRAKNYLNTQGYSTSGMDLEAQPVSSKPDGTIIENPVIGSENFEYQVSDWNHRNSSMTGSTSPASLPSSSCPDAHSAGAFKFPTSSGTLRTTVWTTRLDGNALGCQEYGVSVDKNNNGDVEENEKVFLKNNTVEVAGRSYEVKIHGKEDVEFVYVGEERVEYLNIKRSFPDRDIEKFGRIPLINQASTDNEKALLSTAMIYMLEGENTFGEESDSGVFASTSIISDRGIHKITTRWHR